MAKLLLFDVDQTILSTMGGDRKALNIAFQERFGIPDGFEAIDFAARMDLVIVGEAFRKWGVDGLEEPETMARFKDAYFRHLEVVLAGWTRGRVCPGVRTLLESLLPRDDVHLGLVTGNFRESAFIKLRRYGFHQFFAEGGFGGDFEERSRVVALGIERCQQLQGLEYPRDDIYVIGDSPRDILAGQANGVNTVAVATGFSTQEELGGYNPTHLFADLSDTEAVLAKLLGH